MIRDTDTPSGARQKLVFEYDHQGRRIHKQFYTYSSGWVAQTNNVYLYDAWNLVGELDAANSNAKVRTYIWGTDLSGSMQGAGGIGGLLKVTDYTGGTTTHHFVSYDGNGNLAALTDAGTGGVTARYEYGPFGEGLRRTGAMATNNPVRFSSKFIDNESGMVYYGYRSYNPSIGRWINRDPLGESGSAVSRVAAPGALHKTGIAVAPPYGTGPSAPVGEANEFLFVGNAPLSSIDPLGLTGCSREPCCLVCWKVEHGNPTGSGGCLYSGAKLSVVKPVASGCCPSAPPTAKGGYIFHPEPCRQNIEDSGGPICIYMYSSKDRPDGKRPDGTYK